MSESQWALIRAEARVAVLPIEVKGSLHWPKLKAQASPFLVWDLSTRGISLLIGDKLTAGETVRLTFGTQPSYIFDCCVIWCEEQGSEGGFQGFNYRCGLLASDANALFHKLLEHVGKLKNKV